MYDFFLGSLRKYISLTDEEAALITTRLRQRKVRKKQWLLTPGDLCNNEFFVNKGCFRAYYVDDQGNDHITKFATEGWWISDVDSLFNNKPATQYVEALEDGEVIVLQQEDLDALYEKVPQLNKYFRLVYQKGLANSCARLVRTISQTASDHYRFFITQFPDIEQRVPQYMIASYLGVTPEFLSKIKNRAMKS